MTHQNLVLRGELWLKNQGCSVILNDKLHAALETGERPDVIGWRDSVSILIECKVSRQDFLADQKKSFRLNAALGMGDWRFYLSLPGVITRDDLPQGWGLLYAHASRIEKIHGVPKGNCLWRIEKPFKGNKESETQFMFSALRRLSKKGLLKGAI
jgi:hypothetical protein